MSRFGELLKQRMETNDPKITQTALGSIVGVHRTTISDYITGKYLPTEETFHRIHQVFPDRELYEAYFEAVGKPVTENKPKQMISDAKPYNYYKAEEEPISKIDALRKNLREAKEKIESDIDREYIKRALEFTIRYLKRMNADELTPKEYEAYVKLLEKYKRGA